MKRLHIVGGKNHGKTTLVVELVRALTEQGLRIGTIKHTHHHHELDTPGKDSHRHREAGADVVGICSRSMNAVFWPPATERNGDTDEAERKYLKFAPAFEGCDLVLVEGDSKTEAIKLEVWRGEVGTNPMAKTDPSILAVISDDPPPEHLQTPFWPRSNMAVLIGNILSLDAPQP